MPDITSLAVPSGDIQTIDYSRLVCTLWGAIQALVKQQGISSYSTTKVMLMSLYIDINTIRSSSKVKAYGAVSLGFQGKCKSIGRIQESCIHGKMTTADKCLGDIAGGDGGGTGVFTPNTCLVSDAYGIITASTASSNELGHLVGATSNIQAQLNTICTQSTRNKRVFDELIRLPYNPQMILFSDKVNLNGTKSLGLCLESLFTDKCILLFSNDDGRLVAPSITVARLDGLLPKLTKHTTVIPTLNASLHTINQSRTTQYVSKLWKTN